MRFLKSSAVLLLTLFWVLASNHCALEQVVNLGFLACASHEEAPAESGKDCDNDGCADFENQLYKSESGHVPLAGPSYILAALLIADTSTPAPADVSPALRPGVPPPQLDSAWRFSERASLPPRAPSFLS